MRILALDISTKTGWSSLDDGKLVNKGRLVVSIEDFNVNDFPDRSPKYPHNMLSGAYKMACNIESILKQEKPDIVVIENTVKGRNRHTQRILEWIHKAVLEVLIEMKIKPHYRDPSWWRSIIGVRLTNDDKKNNKLVKEGKKKGKITSKHLAVRIANELFELKLLQKDNDIADSILLGLAFFKDFKRGICDNQQK